MDLFGGHTVKTNTKAKVVKTTKAKEPKPKKEKVIPEKEIDKIQDKLNSISRTVANSYALKFAAGYKAIVYKSGTNGDHASFDTFAFSEDGAKQYCADRNQDGIKYFYKDIKEVIKDLNDFANSMEKSFGSKIKL